MTTRRRGRKPYKPAANGQNAKLSIVVSAKLKNRIDAGAAASGRSQGAEVEYLLNRTLAETDLLYGDT